MSTTRNRTSGRLQGTSSGRLEDHRRALKATIDQLSAARFSTVLTCLVVGIAMTLPLMLASLAVNTGELADDLVRPPSITLYLNSSSSESEGIEISDYLLTLPEIEHVRYVSRADALVEFDEFSGLGFLVRSLPTNPLPASLIVSSHLQGKALDSLVDTLRELPPIDSVQLDVAWLQRLQSINTLVQRLSLIIAGLMAASVVLIIANIARTAISTRQQEIEVISLVGGTRNFIALPFLYTGLAYGLIGALVACLLQPVLTWGIVDGAKAILTLYGSDFSLELVNPGLSLITLCSGSLFGWSGAYLATRLQFRTLGI